MTTSRTTDRKSLNNAKFSWRIQERNNLNKKKYAKTSEVERKQIIAPKNCFSAKEWQWKWTDKEFF